MAWERRAPGASSTAGPGSNTLLVAPWSATDEGAATMAVPGEVTAEEARVLLVTFRRSAATCSARWRATVGDPVALVAIDARTDGERDTDRDRPPAPAASGDVLLTEERADPTWAGSHAREWLRRWNDGDDGDGGDGTLIVYVEGLEVLLDRVGTETAFRFFHLLASRVRRTGAVGRHHLDPSGRSDATRRRFARACETVRVYDGASGDWG